MPYKDKATEKKHQRKAHLKRKYDLSEDAYNILRESQNHRCASCGDKLQGSYKEHVDHDHSTGRVRGILCRWCNLAIGYSNENPEALRAMADYIERQL